MKRLFAISLILLLLSGCTTRTDYGDCIGAFDERDPTKAYKLDVTNTVVAFLFSWTIFVPVVVVANQTWCPSANKAK